MRTRLALIALLAVAPLGASPGAEPVTIAEGIAYGEEPRQQLDLYRPASVDDDTPVLVFFYGGGWERGERGDLRETGEALAAGGLIVAVPDYRLYPDAVFPEFVEDGALAGAYIWRTVRRADGSPRPIFVGGHSAGAFNAAMLAVDERYLVEADVPPSAVAGALLLSGPYDMSGALPQPFSGIFPRETRDQAGAAAFVDGGEPPILLLTVDADDVVDPRNAYRLAEAIEGAGGDVSVSAYSGERDHLATFRGLADAGSAVRRDVDVFIAVAAAQWQRQQP